MVGNPNSDQDKDVLCRLTLVITRRAAVWLVVSGSLMLAAIVAACVWLSVVLRDAGWTG